MCSIQGCAGKAIAKGLCSKHYMRLRRTGDATKVTKPGPKPTVRSWRVVATTKGGKRYSDGVRLATEEEAHLYCGVAFFDLRNRHVVRTTVIRSNEEPTASMRNQRTGELIRSVKFTHGACDQFGWSECNARGEFLGIEKYVGSQLARAKRKPARKALQVKPTAENKAAARMIMRRMARAKAAAKRHRQGKARA
jgi:hypothetical protein